MAGSNSWDNSEVSVINPDHQLKRRKLSDDLRLPLSVSNIAFSILAGANTRPIAKLVSPSKCHSDIQNCTNASDYQETRKHSNASVGNRDSTPQGLCGAASANFKSQLGESLYSTAGQSMAAHASTQSAWQHIPPTRPKASRFSTAHSLGSPVPCESRDGDQECQMPSLRPFKRQISLMHDAVTRQSSDDLHAEESNTPDSNPGQSFRASAESPHRNRAAPVACSQQLDVCRKMPGGPIGRETGRCISPLRREAVRQQHPDLFANFGHLSDATWPSATRNAHGVQPAHGISGCAPISDPFLQAALDSQSMSTLSKAADVAQGERVPSGQIPFGDPDASFGLDLNQKAASCVRGGPSNSTLAPLLTAVLSSPTAVSLELSSVPGLCSPSLQSTNTSLGTTSETAGLARRPQKCWLAGPSGTDSMILKSLLSSRSESGPPNSSSEISDLVDNQTRFAPSSPTKNHEGRSSLERSLTSESGVAGLGSRAANANGAQVERSQMLQVLSAATRAACSMRSSLGGEAWVKGKGPHVCKTCGIRFPTYQALGGHQNSHRQRVDSRLKVTLESLKVEKPDRRTGGKRAAKKGRREQRSGGSPEPTGAPKYKSMRVPGTSSFQQSVRPTSGGPDSRSVSPFLIPVAGSVEMLVSMTGGSHLRQQEEREAQQMPRLLSHLDVHHGFVAPEEEQKETTPRQAAAHVSSRADAASMVTAGSLSATAGWPAEIPEESRLANRSPFGRFLETPDLGRVTAGSQNTDELLSRLLSPCCPLQCTHRSLPCSRQRANSLASTLQRAFYNGLATPSGQNFLPPSSPPSPLPAYPGPESRSTLVGCKISGPSSTQIAEFLVAPQICGQGHPPSPTTHDWRRNLVKHQDSAGWQAQDEPIQMLGSGVEADEHGAGHVSQVEANYLASMGGHLVAWSACGFQNTDVAGNLDLTLHL